MKTHASLTLLFPVMVACVFAFCVGAAHADEVVTTDVSITTGGMLTHGAFLLSVLGGIDIETSAISGFVGTTTAACTLQTSSFHLGFDISDSSHHVSGGVCLSQGVPDNSLLKFTLDSSATTTNYVFYIRKTNGQFFADYSGIDWGAVNISPIINWGNLQFAATSTSLFADATSTLEAIASQCDDAGNIFSRGLCWAGTYLFVPNPNVLNQYAALPQLVQTKFPFSWVSGVKEEFDTLSASSSTQSFSVDMSTLGMGSTSPIGNVLPNITLFSTSTVTRFMPAGMWAAIQALMAAALWIALGYDIYITVRRRHAHV